MKWVVKEKKSDDLAEQLLANRGIENRESFLNPDFQRDLLNPFLLSDMEKAVIRLIQAIEREETVGIFADYDHDGTPGAAILYLFLKKIGHKKIAVYIPSREEGYGLNEKGIDYFKNNGVSLMITVDLGIAGKEGVEYAKGLGIETIITDHHEIQKDLFPSSALAVINPKYEQENFAPYLFKGLCGAAIAWKLAWATAEKLEKEKDYQAKIRLELSAQIPNLKIFLKWQLDLVAIATVCDMVPLVGENRIFAKFGLMVLQKEKNLGLKKLYEVAAINLKKIDAYTLGFQIGPRLNAPGRLAHNLGKNHGQSEANLAFNLLVTEDENEVLDLAVKLNRYNYERQQELEKILNEAIGKVRDKKLDKKKIIVVSGDGWPVGIVGLVAGKLKEIYSRPVIALGSHGEIAQGSGRSIDSFHLVEAFEHCQEYLTKYGGHAKAAGLTLELKHLEDLYDRLSQLAETQIKDEDLEPKIEIDAEITPDKISWDLVALLEKFEPFGIGNPRPIFLLSNMEIRNTRMLGADGKHLKLEIGSGNKIFDAIGFDKAADFSDLKIGQKIDLACNIERNVFNGNHSIQLKILDLKISPNPSL